MDFIIVRRIFYDNIYWSQSFQRGTRDFGGCYWRGNSPSICLMSVVGRLSQWRIDLVLSNCEFREGSTYTREATSCRESKALLYLRNVHLLVNSRQLNASTWKKQTLHLINSTLRVSKVIKHLKEFPFSSHSSYISDDKSVYH